jgi:hypothetical protein
MIVNKIVLRVVQKQANVKQSELQPGATFAMYFYHHGEQMEERRNK